VYDTMTTIKKNIGFKIVVGIHTAIYRRWNPEKNSWLLNWKKKPETDWGNISILKICYPLTFFLKFIDLKDNLNKVPTMKWTKLNGSSCLSNHDVSTVYPFKNTTYYTQKFTKNSRVCSLQALWLIKINVIKNSIP